MSGNNPINPDEDNTKQKNNSSKVLNIVVAPRVVFFVLISIFIVYGCFFLTHKAPFVYLKPGPAELVSISGKDMVEKLDGTYRFTTVIAQEMTYWDLLINSFKHDKVVYGEANSLPAASTTLSEMDQSKLMAIGMATGISAGKKVLAGTGAIVISTKPNSVAERCGLTVGDVIISINKLPVKNVIDLKALLKSQNGKLTLEVVNKRVKREVEVTPFNNQLGIEVQTYLTASLTPNLTIKTSDVGGPSAGLIFTLAAIDSIGKGSLSNGKVITGTGTIEGTGKVGEIEGIDFKIINAIKAGGWVFFYPSNNQPPKVPKNSMIKVVPVKDVYQAINWLCAQGATDEICSTGLINSSDN